MAHPAHSSTGKGSGPRRTHLRSWKAAHLLFSLLLILAGTGCGKRTSSSTSALPVVEVAAVIERDVPISREWVGTLQGYVNAQIQPQVTGYLIKQDYREGTYVHRNQVLFDIDPRPFKAALDQAKGQLAEAEAALGQYTLDVSRDIPEAQAHAIPQMQLETDRQQKLAAAATVQADEAAVEQAQLNLGYTKVRSLIGGIAGIAQIQVGNLVSPSTVLTAVSQVNPIKAYFAISGADWLRMAAKIDADPGNLPSRAKSIPLQLTLSSGETYGHSGQILFADRAMSLQTGTIEIVGVFPNLQRVLRPQEPVTVRGVTGVRRNALLVPQTAVMQLQGGYLVAVVGPDDRISIRNVQVGRQVGALWMVTRGLRPHERVVVVGAEKVQSGMQVTPVPYTASTPHD